MDDVIKSPLYYQITERLSDEDLHFFKAAIEEYMASNYGNSDYFRGQMSRKTWSIVDFYFNKLEEYFREDGEDENAEQDH